MQFGLMPLLNYLNSDHILLPHLIGIKYAIYNYGGDILKH